MKNFLPMLTRKQTGLTLIELMISMVVGMLLVVFVGSMYINSKDSFRLNDDNARLHEDASFALAFMGRNFMQAGFGNVYTAHTTDFNDPDFNVAGVPRKAVEGCDGGFVAPTAGTPNFSCDTGGKPAFRISYRVEGTYDANTGAGADCNGQDVTSPDGIAVNSFFLHTAAGDTVPSLYCSGNGGAGAQPVLGNVEDMRVEYGVDTKGTFSPDQYLNAAAVEALPPNAINKRNWEQVVSVRVCLLVSTPNKVIGEQTYTDCAGAAQTSADGKMRRAFTSVFALRNNATPSLVY